MQFKMLCAPLLSYALLSGNALLAGQEYMEVTAPNECCAGDTMGLSLVAGMAGTPVASAAGKAVQEILLKDAITKAAKRKSKDKEKEEDEDETQYDEVLKGDRGVLETLIHELGLFFRQVTGSGKTYKFKYKGKDGEELDIEECTPSGPLNPKKLNCTEQKVELFMDPVEGRERWAFTMSVVRAKYNPKNYYANANGYYGEVVDGQTFTIVFDTESDLAWQLNQIAAAQ